MPRVAQIYEMNKVGSGFPLFSPAKSKNYLLSCDSIRVSDVWSFLNYTIRVSKHKSNGQQLNSAQQKYLLDLLDQSEYFYETAQVAPIKSQPLLYYYSFMNLTKIAINLDKFEGGSKKYVHGITESITATTKLNNAEIKLWQSKGVKLSISEYLLKVLEDTPLSYVHDGSGASKTVKVMDLLRDCVGINRTYSEISNVSEHFYKLLDVKCHSQRNKLVLKAKVDGCDDAAMNDLNGRGYHVTKVGDDFFVDMDSYVKTTPSPTIAEWHSLSKKLRNQGLWGYTDGVEYKLYISPSAQRISSPAIIYHAMFFFGSITRYHPDLFDSIMSAKEYWLVSEFLKTQPQQFLYYMISYINGAEVLFSKQV